MGNRFHISTGGSPAECVARERSCPRGGEQPYLRALGLEGPARPSVRVARKLGVREKLFGVREYFRSFKKSSPVPQSFGEITEEEEGVLLSKVKALKKNLGKGLLEFDDFRTERRRRSKELEDTVLEYERSLTQRDVPDESFEKLENVVLSSQLENPVELATSRDHRVRNVLATVHRSGNDEEYDRAMRVLVRNERNPVVLKSLGKGSDSVKTGLYKRGDLFDVSAVSVLSRVSDPAVRRGAALNDNISRKDLQRLLKDKDDSVVIGVYEGVKNSYRINDKELVGELIDYPYAPPSAYKFLSMSEDLDVDQKIGLFEKSSESFTDDEVASLIKSTGRDRRMVDTVLDRVGGEKVSYPVADVIISDPNVKKEHVVRVANSFKGVRDYTSNDFKVIDSISSLSRKGHYESEIPWDTTPMSIWD